LSSLAIPAGYDATKHALFTGPNNLTRIPNIDLNGATGTHFEISVGPGEIRLTTIRSATIFPGLMERINSSSAQAGRSIRKFRTCFGQTQGGFNFDGTFTTPSGQKTLIRQ